MKFSSSDLVGLAFSFRWYLSTVRVMNNLLLTCVGRKGTLGPRRAGSASSPSAPCSKEVCVSLDDNWMALFLVEISFISALLRYNLDLTSSLFASFSTGCTVTVGLNDMVLLLGCMAVDCLGRCTGTATPAADPWYGLYAITTLR
jgi:hypothetical protein